MAHVVKDRVQETTTTTGTGTLTLGGAVTGFQTFSSAIGNTNTTYYAIQNGSEWEVGIGTVGAGTLSRDTILESSNAGSAVNLSAGTKQVFCTYPAERSVDINTAQTLTNKTISVDDNTVSGIAASSFVLSNASGNIDGSVAQKAIPSGVVVGTTDTQTLTNKTLDGGTVVTANSSADALRITQTGAGNAIRIEDAANPDATPTVIDQNGRVIVGGTTPYSADTVTPKIQVVTDTVFDGGFGGSSWSSDANGQITWFAKSKSGTIGTHSAVTTNDVLMDIRNYGSDGSAFAQSARIASFVDGTVASNSVPSRITFSTTAVGGTSATERMRITSSGGVGIGVTPGAGQTLNVGKSITGSTFSTSIVGAGTVQSDVTSRATYFGSFAATAATTFTLSQLIHFYANQGTFGAGSTVSSQYGFLAENSLVNATNNYGFFSGIASGTGRWNFYANGTAANYFAGTTLIGNITDRGGSLQLAGSTSAAATTQRITGFAFDSRLRLGRANAAETIVASGDSIGILAFDGYDGAAYIASAQISAVVDGTPGTNDMPGRLVFSTTADGASSTTERFRISSFGGWGLAGANYGTSGTQAIVSNGNAAAPTWQDVVTPTASQTLTNKTLTDPTITGTIIEDVFALTDGATVNVDPANGSIQTLTLAGTGRTLTFTNMLNGEAITLMINDGTAGTITTWNATFVNNGGAAPTLSLTGFTVVSVWKVAGTVYAAVVGNA